jgi:alkyl sulfatase BDS1-like metallo-beta-lactamase superfamily hydrolase
MVDGVRMIFLLTPDTGAPVEMATCFPDMKALWMAENVQHGMHNIYTLRGAPVRDALNWSKYIWPIEVFFELPQALVKANTNRHFPGWHRATTSSLELR